MKKQALVITLAELTELKRELIKQQEELNLRLGLDQLSPIDYDRKMLIGIINKTPKCSDTWEILK